MLRSRERRRGKERLAISLTAKMAGGEVRGKGEQAGEEKEEKKKKREKEEKGKEGMRGREDARRGREEEEEER